MTNADQIEAEFSDYAISHAGLLLFRPDDALRLIQRSREVGLKILGVDAFFERPGGVQPSMENSIDFTLHRNRPLLQNSWLHAEQFIRDRASATFLFEVVLEANPGAEEI